MTEAKQSITESERQSVRMGLKDVKIPSHWEVKTAGDIFNIKKDKFDPDTSDGESGVYLYSMPAYDEGESPKQTQMKEVGSKKYIVPEDCILFPKLNIFLKRFWRVRHNHDEPAICSTEYWPLIINEQINLDYYYYYFNSHYFMRNPKVSLASGTDSHRRVRESSFKKVKLPVPPLSEQNRIANRLKTIDKNIQQTSSYCNNLKELKKGLMQDLLTKGIAHTEFQIGQLGPKKSKYPQSWDIVKLEDISRVKRGASPRPISDEKYFGGDVGWVRISDVSDAGKYLISTEDYLSELGVEESVKISQDTVLLSISATVGKPCILKTEACIHDGIVAFRNLSSEIDTDFLYYTLLNSRKRLQAKGQTGTQSNINSKIVKKTKILLPPLSEQKKISTILSKSDDVLSQRKEKKEKFIQIKRGLMQDLLHGKRKIPPTD